ncbi:MAG TPA: sigma factor [Phycisphaerae bacterium]|nr:sigma factor [Phycisphaerae bacterium]
MTRSEKEAPSRRMSQRQLRKVEANLPLVRLTLRRHRSLARPAHRLGREADELLQEGCLALVEAVRSHDPARHGDFASFAMARVHHAMSRFVHEQRDLIRVPFIMQRRMKRRRQGSRSDRHCPHAPPRVVKLRNKRMTPNLLRAQRSYAERLSGRAEGVTIGELIRDRYDLAMEQVVRQMRLSPRATDGNDELLDRCVEERWTVPESDARTSIRQMAKELGCSTGRIAHCEDRFRVHLQAILLKDEVCAKLLEIARRSEAGMWQRLKEQELEQFRREAPL